MIQQNSSPQFEEIDLKTFLSDLGFRLVDDGKYWRSNAAYRDGDNPTALRIHKKSGFFTDFVEDKKGSLKDLLKLTTGEDIKKLEDYFSKTGVFVELTRDKPTVSQETIFNNNCLSKLVKNYKFYHDRGISSDTLSRFKAGLAMEGKMYLRFVFPIYNSYGEIHGFDGRDVAGRFEGSLKWKKIGRKSNWVYPVYVPNVNNELDVLSEIRAKKQVIIVESIGDMLSLYEAGVKNVIVTFGTSFSEKICAFILSLPGVEVVIATNNDFDKEETKTGNVGEKFSFKVFEKLLSYVDYHKILIHLPTRKDFGEMTQEEIDSWVAGIKKVDKKIMYANVLSHMRALYKAGELSKHSEKIAKSIALEISDE